MESRRLLVAATICSLLLGMLGLALYASQRADRCAYVPLLAPELLPNADLSAPGDPPTLPAGWVGATSGISLTGFTVLPGGRSLQLLGIANYVQTPLVAPVRPGTSYCFQAQALTDSPQRSATRLRLDFQWLDRAGAVVAEHTTPWQPVALWQPNRAPAGWSVVAGAAVAPNDAVGLRVRVRPASDDRIYLDQMHLRPGRWALGTPAQLRGAPNAAAVDLLPWPEGRRAALSFSFDWETAMGGLVHSRSVGEPTSDQDFILRAMRMREGVTTTLEIFRPHGIRATYYGNGYNFLQANVEQRRFMGDPTFLWANKANRWLSDRWQTTPWFADDPHGTAGSQPAWYFGDLVPLLLRERHAIQSHTFSHLYGGLASIGEWQADLVAWNQLAAEAGVAPARSLAFPWSGSDGISDASWDALERAGIRSVTRLSDNPPFRIVASAEPRCRPVPGHERILACPDFYLKPDTAAEAQRLIDATLAVSGTLDLWAHTEEVTSPEQIAAWQRVVAYAAGQPGLWIAPLHEIADWQQGISEVRVEHTDCRIQDTGCLLAFRVTNSGLRDLEGVVLALPFVPGLLEIDGQLLQPQASSIKTQPVAPNTLALNLKAGQTATVVAFP